MSPTPTLQIKVGALIAISLVILSVTIFLMGRERRLFERRVYYELRFSRTVGLREGAPVSLTGVRVGSVEDLSFPRDIRENYIVVRIGVVGDVAPRIRKDTMARIRTQGLLGDKYIELSGGSPQAARVPAGGLIAAVESVDYEVLLGEGGDVIQNLTEATRSLKAVLKSIEEGKGLLGHAVSSKEEARWDESLSNLHAASASLRNILGSVERGEGLLGQLVKNQDAGKAVVEDLRASMAHMRQGTESMQRTAQKIEKGEGTLGTLIQDPTAGREMLMSLRRSVANLESVTTQLREGGGMLPRLIADRPYADRVLGHLEQTTRDLGQIMGKIERGEGTIGALVNDPDLYREAKDVLGTAKGSWLFSVYRFFRNLGFSGQGSPPGEASQGSKKQAD